MNKIFIYLVFVLMLFSKLHANNQEEEEVLKNTYDMLIDFYEYKEGDEASEGNPEALKLEQAVALAYRNNSALMAYRAEFESSAEVYQQAFSTWLPQAALDFSYNEILGGNNAFSAATVPNLTLSANISMNLFESFGGVNNIESAGNLVLSMVYDYYNKEQSVVLEVVQAYLKMLEGSMVVNLREKQAKALEEHYSSVSVGVRVGSATKTDLSQAKSSYLEALSLAQIATVEFNTAKLDLERMIKVKADRLNVPTHLKLKYKNLDDILKVVKDKNPTYLTALYNNMYYEQQVGVKRSKLLPRVDANLGYNYSAYKEQITTDQGSLGNNTDEIRGSVQLKVPLYDAGIYRSQLRASKKNAEQTKYLLEDSVVQIRASARTYLETLKANLIYMDAVSSQVDASYEALKGVKIEYRVGTKTNTDLLDAESQYYETQVNLVRAYMQYLISQFNILYITGSMGVKDLGSVPVDKVYDPSIYADKVKHRFFSTSTPDAEDVFIDREQTR